MSLKYYVTDARGRVVRIFSVPHRKLARKQKGLGEKLHRFDPENPVTLDENNSQNAEHLRIRGIKKAAGKIIEARVPMFKQLNMMADAIISGDIQALKEARQWINQVQQASNQAEANGTAVEDFQP